MDLYYNNLALMYDLSSVTKFRRYLPLESGKSKYNTDAGGLLRTRESLIYEIT